MYSKLVTRILLLGFVGILASPFIMKDSEGNPLMTPKEFFQFELSFIKKSYVMAINTLRGIKETVSDTKEDEGDITTLYKWKDEKGEWHYSDKAAGNASVEEVRINNRQNVLGFDDVKKELNTGQLNESDTSQEAAKHSASPGKSQEDSQQSAPVEYIKRITGTLDDAQNVQELIDKNHEEKTKALERLR